MTRARGDAGAESLLSRTLANNLPVRYQEPLN
jgi:hypothetical protein